MKRLLLFISSVIFLFSFTPKAEAQYNQNTSGGAATVPINFPGTGCSYNWVNDTPGIGLPTSGTGNIPSFIAVNNGNTPITATITGTPAGSFAYIANSNSNNVTVINTSSNMVVKNITVGFGPYCLSVSADGSRVYVTNFEDNTVSVISTATNTVINTIGVGKAPYGVCVSPDGRYVYTANEISNDVSVINTINNTVSTINVGSSGTSNATGIAISPDGSKLYVTNFAFNTLLVLDAATGNTITTIPVNLQPFNVITSPNGKQVYVVDGGSVTVIDASSNAITAIIPVGTNAVGIAISPDGNSLYVSNNSANTVSVIKTVMNAITANVAVGKGPSGIDVSPDGSQVYVANEQDGTVSVISTATNKVTFGIGTGSGPVSYGNFITSSSGCKPATFTITVNPNLAPVAITANQVTGSILACAGLASAIPYIEQISVSGTNLTKDITATAPAGFEVSTAEGGGYANSVTLTQQGGKINNGVVFVRSAATAQPGYISGNVLLTSAGAGSTAAAVSGFIRMDATVTQVASQAVVNGSATAAVNFTGTGNIFNWVNDIPAIGLAASGSGNISSFVGINNSGSPVKATITVTPQSIGFAYVANQTTKSVSVINMETNTVISTIPVGQTPVGVSVSPDGSRAYVSNQQDQTISVINTATNTVINTIRSPGFSPTGISVSPDGKLLYVVNLNSNNVSIINTSTYAPTATINVGGYPLCVALSPDGNKAYVTNSTNSVTAIDNKKNTVTNIPVAKGPYGLAVSPDGSKLYVANSGANVLTVINTATNSVAQTIPVDANPTGVAVSPDGSRVYVSALDKNTISIINTADYSVSRIAAGSKPFGLSLTTDGSNLYVADEGSNIVTVINTSNNTVIAAIPVGGNPESIGNFITAGTGCGGPPINFTITVKPTSTTPTITAAGTLSPLTTIYGTPSPSASFTVAGDGMTNGILITPPPGLEVSADNIKFSSTITVGSAGIIAATPVYVRLAATTLVGNYQGNILLISPGASGINEATANNIVNRAPLIATADNKTKTFGAANPVLTISYSGFVNNDNPSQLMPQPNIYTSATTTSVAGTYLINIVGGASPNYKLDYVTGILTITPAQLARIFIPNAFTPNNDQINDTWDIKNIENFPNSTVEVYNRWGEKLYSSIGYPIAWNGKYKGAYLPTGTYYYIINLKNGTAAIAGYVAIIR